MERVARQVQLTQQVLATADAEWSDIANALDELAHAIETLGHQQSMRDAARQLLPISNELGAQITGFRSKLVGQVCGHIARMVKIMKRDFRELANDLLPSLVSTAKGASGAVRQPGAMLFKVISEHVRYDLQFFRKIFAQSPQEKTRVLMLDQLAVILACWQKEDIEPYYSEVVEIIRRGLPDPAQQVRSATRDVLCSFASLWEERVEELVDIPSGPARDLLLKEKPHAIISLAILKKYPELQRKVSRTEKSSKTIAKQRSLYQKSSSIEAQDVEIHVATPPGKKRADQETKESPKDTQARPSLPRQLFREDESEKPKPTKSVLPRLSPSKVSAMNSESEPQSISSGIPVPPASTRPDDIFRRSRIELKAEGSKIPPPPTKSPVPRSQLTSRAFGVSRSQDTPPVEPKKSPSLIPRPGGPTSVSMVGLKLASNSPPESAGDENLSAALNVRDRFLDNPIPSSDAAPTPRRSDSNVTVRPRRKTATSTDENEARGQDPVPVPASSAASVPPTAMQPPQREALVPPVASVSAIDASSSTQCQVPREQPLLLVQEQEPLPPTISLGSAVFEQVPPHKADFIAEQTVMPAEEEKAAIKPDTGAQEVAVMNTFDEQVATSNDADIEETMLISREAAARDYVEKVPDVRERVRREEESSDSLTKNALENLKGIQKTMATLQALTKVDVRGLPLKPRVGKVAEPPTARPRSADWISSAANDQPRRAKSQGGKLATSSVPAKRQAGDGRDFTYPVRESDVTHTLFEIDEEFKSEGAAGNRAVEKKSRDANMRGVRPRTNRRSGHSQHRAGQYESRQPDYPSQRPRHGKQPNADFDRDQVERQFQGILREAEASRSRPSSAERVPAPSENSVMSARFSSQDSSSFEALVRNENGARSSMEPPLQWSVEPADTIKSREPVGVQSENRSRTDTGRLHREESTAHRSNTVHSGCRRSQPNAAETAKKTPWISTSMGYFAMLLGFLFGASGLLRAATTVRDTHDYHQALKVRIGMLESSISESYSSVRKLEENYAVWSEYVRVLAEEDETHALSLLETIQHEVEKWQVEMKHDLTQFKKSLSVDVVEAALAPLLQNSTEKSDS